LADGTVARSGGKVVKNVAGYDLPKLFAGSLGTLGVIEQATLRCRPRPAASRWCTVPPGGGGVFYRPAAHLYDGTREYVLLEGAEEDVTAQARAAQPYPPPMLPDGAHRGRISIVPGRVRDLGRALNGTVRWCAELGVGTVHVAADTAVGLARARTIAHAHGGWLLREAGGDPTDDGFGCALPNLALMRRVKRAFDPDNRCNPGRLPL
jgi:glycolate oxidase FAD binding subunit